jgi:hypothetical protein
MYCVEIIVVSCDSHYLRVIIQTIYVLSDVISGVNPPCVVDLPCPLPTHPWIEPLSTYPGYVGVFGRIIVGIQMPLLLLSLLSETVLYHEHPWPLARIHLFLSNEFVLLNLYLLLDGLYLLHPSHPDLLLPQPLYLLLQLTLIWLLMLVVIAMKPWGLFRGIFMVLLLL